MALIDDFIANEQARIDQERQYQDRLSTPQVPQEPSFGRGVLSALGTGGAYLGQSGAALAEMGIRALGSPDEFPALQRPIEATQRTQQYFERRGRELAQEAPELSIKNIDWTSPSSIAKGAAYNIAATAPIMAGATLTGSPATALAAVTSGSVYANQPKEKKSIPTALAFGGASGILDYYGFSKLPGASRVLSKIGGMTREQAKEYITKNLLREIGKGIGKGLAAEVPTEVAQQVLERKGAFKNLTDEEARDEYLQAGLGAMLVGGPLGGLGATVETIANNRQVLIDNEVRNRLENKDKPVDLGTNNIVDTPQIEGITTEPITSGISPTRFTALGELPVVDTASVPTVTDARISNKIKLNTLPEQVQTLLSALPAKQQQDLFGYNAKTKTVDRDKLLTLGNVDLEGYTRQLGELDTQRAIRREQQALPTGTQMALRGFEDRVAYPQSELMQEPITQIETTPEEQLTFEQAPGFTPNLPLEGGVAVQPNLEYGSPFSAPQEGLVGPTISKKVNKPKKVIAKKVATPITIDTVLQDRTKEKPVADFAKAIEQANTETDMTIAANKVQTALTKFNKATGLSIPFEQQSMMDVYRAIKATPALPKREQVTDTTYIEQYGKQWAAYSGEGTNRILLGTYATKKAAKVGATPIAKANITKKVTPTKEVVKPVIIKPKTELATTDSAIAVNKGREVASVLREYAESAKEAGMSASKLVSKSEEMLNKLAELGFHLPEHKGAYSLNKAKELADSITAKIVAKKETPKKEVAYGQRVGDFVYYKGKQYEIVEINTTDNTVLLENVETGKELKNPVPFSEVSFTKKSTTINKEDTFASAKVIHERLATSKIGKVIQPLIKQKIINIVDSFEHLPIEVKSKLSNDFSGVYFNNKVYLIANNINPSNLHGLILHEVAVHYGLRKMLGEKNYTNIMKQLESLKESGNKAVQEAFNTVPQDTIPEDINEEALGYLMEKYHKQPFVQKVISHIKAWLFRMGIINANKLSDKDIIALTKAALSVKPSFKANNIVATPKYSYIGIQGIEQLGYSINTLPDGAFSSIVDKKIRYELDDSPMRLLLDHNELKDVAVSLLAKEAIYLDEVIEHDKLFDLYPSFRTIKVLSKDLGPTMNGGIDMRKKVLILNENKAFDDNKLKQLIIHEVQHAIQNYESFAVGSSTSIEERAVSMDASIEDTIEEKKKIRDDLIKKLDTYYNKSGKEIFKNQEEIHKLEIALDKARLDLVDAINKKNPYNRYQMSAGEIEARDAATRAFLTKEERRSNPPLSSEKAPISKWIARFDDGAYKYMASEDVLDAARHVRYNQVMSNLSDSPFINTLTSETKIIGHALKNMTKALAGLPYWTKGMEEVTKETIRLNEYFNENIAKITSGGSFEINGKTYSSKSMAELRKMHTELDTKNPTFKQDFDDIMVMGDILEKNFITKAEIEKTLGRSISDTTFNYYREFRQFADNTRYFINSIISELYPKDGDKKLKNNIVKYIQGHMYRVRRYGQYAVRGYVERPSKSDANKVVREQIYTKFFDNQVDAANFAQALKKNPEKYFKWYFNKEKVDGNFTTEVEKEVNFKDAKNIFQLISAENAMSEAISKLMRRDSAGKYTDVDANALQKEVMEKLSEEILDLRGLGRMIKRSDKLIEGYENTDIFENFTYAVQNTARSLAKAKYAFNQYRFIKSLDRQYQQDAFDFVKETLLPRTQTDQVVSAFRNMNTIALLGFRLIQPLVNLTQTFVMGLPELTRVIQQTRVDDRGNSLSFMAANKIAAAELWEAFWHTSADLYKSGLPKSGRDSITWVYTNILQRAGLHNPSDIEKGSGHITEIEREVLNRFSRAAIELQSIANAQNGIDEDIYFKDKSVKRIAQVTDFATAPLFASELLNKEAAVLASYRALTTNKEAFDEKAYKLAEKYVMDAHGVMNKYNMPKIGRTTYGRLFYSLLSYPLHYYNYLNKRLIGGMKDTKSASDVYAGLYSLALLVALGGLKGLPFEDMFDYFLSKIFKVDYKLKLRQQLGEVLGSDNIGYAITNGATTLFGADISNNVSIRTPFISGMLEDKDGLESLAGASGAIIQKVRNADTYAARGDVLGMLMSLTPEVTANAYRQFKNYTEGYRTVGYNKQFFKGEEQKPDLADALLAAFVGLRTTDIAYPGEIRKSESAIEKQWSGLKRDYIAKYKRTKDFSYITKFNSALEKSQARNLVRPITQRGLKLALSDKPNELRTRFEQQDIADML